MVADDEEEDIEVTEWSDLFVFVEEPEEDILRDFRASKELLDRLFKDGVSEGEDNSFEAIYALNCCSD